MQKYLLCHSLIVEIWVKVGSLDQWLVLHGKKTEFCGPLDKTSRNPNPATTNIR